ILRRQMEHSLGAFKWMFIIMLPLLLCGWFANTSDGVPWLWMDPGRVVTGGQTVAHDHLYEAKAGYLGMPFFTVRFCLYFLVWVGLAELLRRHSYSMDDDGDPRHYRLA